jgi:DHA1 family tetracycline resistance protein-like MFS transporter
LGKNPNQGEPSASSPSVNQATRKGSLALIFFVMLMDIIGITLLLPVAPKIVLRFSDSAVMVTMITVIYAGGQFFAAPLLGKIGDRVGRRPVLLLSMVGQAVGYIVFGVGGSLWMLLLGRLIGGITSGNLSTANAYIADVSKPEERSKNFAMISTAWSLGLILGPMLGGIFGQLSLEAPAFVAGGVSLLNAVLGFFLLPESLPKERREHAPLRLRDSNPIASIFDMARKPGLALLLLVTALFSFAFNGNSSISALFLIEKFNAATWQVSLLMVGAGLAIALSNTFLVPRWMPRFGERVTGIGSLLGLALASTGIFFAPIIWLVLLINMIFGATSAFIFPSLQILSIDHVSPREVGQLLGVTSAVGSLMNIFGPLWAGFVYDRVMMGSPYWMGAILFIITAFMLFRTQPRTKRETLTADVAEL